MAQGWSSPNIKQLTWILVCWAIINPRFDKRKKRLVLGRTIFINREGKKNVCHLQFISSCRMGTSGLPACYPLTTRDVLVNISVKSYACCFPASSALHSIFGSLLCLYLSVECFPTFFLTTPTNHPPNPDSTAYVAKCQLILSFSV